MDIRGGILYTFAMNVCKRCIIPNAYQWERNIALKSHSLYTRSPIHMSSQQERSLKGVAKARRERKSRERMPRFLMHIII